MIKAIYFSPTKTTAKIIGSMAQKLQQLLNCNMQTIDVTLPNKRTEQITLAAEDILLIGLPVYAGRIPYFLEDFLKNIKGKDNIAIAVCVYGNRDYDDALLELVNILNENKFNVIAAGAFVGEHSYSYKVAAGRPDDKDLQIAIEFTEKVGQKLEQGANIDKITVKGNLPYKERMPSPKIAPKTKDSCVKCMLCSMNCPALAIDGKDPFSIDEEKCIRCFACVKNCPYNSKYFDNENILASKAKLETSFLVRKEPEFFI